MSLTGFLSYSRVNWQQSPSKSTPWNATNLNIMDAGIKNNNDMISNLRDEVTQLNSNMVNTGNMFIYRSSGGNIKSITISVKNTGQYNGFRYSPFIIFGGKAFLTGLFNEINSENAVGNITAEYVKSDLDEKVIFSNLPLFSNIIIIACNEKSATWIVDEKK